MIKIIKDTDFLKIRNLDDMFILGIGCSYSTYKNSIKAYMEKKYKLQRFGITGEIQLISEDNKNSRIYYIYSSKKCNDKSKLKELIANLDLFEDEKDINHYINGLLN